MKVPLSWLREYVAFETPAGELAQRLAVASAEVERVYRVGVPDEDGNLGRFLVGRVVEAGKHPNADRLQLCRVDVGEAEARQIVCGAWNFGAGATVCVALPGAVLPDGRTLERAKLRGELSDGMILAEDELELGPDHTGIIVLEDGHEPGTPLVDLMPVRDDVLELEVTGNRPDLLSVYGLAREVAALLDRPLAPPPGHDPPREGYEAVEIEIDDLEGCPRYIGRLFRGVEIGESPLWLRSRLVRSGVRAISNVVDVTNYVMLALGSPLHVFDAERLAGGRIGVRRAEAGEKLVTLDGAERALEPSRPPHHGCPPARCHRRDHGRPRVGGHRDDDRRRCSRRRASSRSASCARPSGSAFAARPRPAGRRASTRTSRGRLRCSRPSCSSRRQAVAGSATRTSGASFRPGRSRACGPPARTPSSGSRSTPPSSGASSSGSASRSPVKATTGA